MEQPTYEPTPEELEARERLIESDAPLWAKLAAIGPQHLTPKAELLVRLNMRQQGGVPKKIHTYKGAKR